MQLLKQSHNVQSIQSIQHNQYPSLTVLPPTPTPNETRHHDKLELAIENIASQGCLAVNKLLHTLKKGKIPTQLHDYSPTERAFIYQELKAVMDIYGGRICNL